MSSSQHHLDKQQRRTRDARKADVGSKHNKSSSTILLIAQADKSVDRSTKMTLEEANVLRNAQEYTQKFFERKASPEKQMRISPMREQFKGQDFRREQERKCKQDLIRARQARSPLKKDGSLGHI